MDNLNPLMDPRKQELLEARFLGSRGFPSLATGHASFNPQTSNQDSNLSSTSVGSQPSDGEVQVMRTPPQERKRKRKDPPQQDPTPKRNLQLANSSNNPAAQSQPIQAQQQDNKKISEYFMKNQAQHSPGR